MIKRTLIFAAALGTMLAVQPALAESIAVPFNDLDLSTEAGQKELDKRIEVAARKVCGFDEASVGTRITTREEKACVADARKQLEKRLASLTNKKVAGS